MVWCCMYVCLVCAYMPHGTHMDRPSMKGTHPVGRRNRGHTRSLKHQCEESQHRLAWAKSLGSLAGPYSSRVSSRTTQSPFLRMESPQDWCEI